MRFKKFMALGLVMTSLVGVMTGTASALEYEFDSDAPGQTFHQSTSTDENYMGNSDQLVIGMDGDISSDTTGNFSNSPLSCLDVPIGEYPDAWGDYTDVAIAQNTMIPNELGPTANNANFYRPTYTPVVMTAGLAPLYNYAPNGLGMGGYSAMGASLSAGQSGTIAGSMGMSGGVAGMGGGQVVQTAGGGYVQSAASGVATQNAPMPAITEGGAIGQLSIPSIGLNKYVYEGTSTKNMQKGLAHFDSTSGWSGNIAIAGHNRGGHAYFGKLKDVQIGDTVTYTTAYGTATYQISDIGECETSDTSGLLQDGSNKITMYTCKANQPEVKLKVTAIQVG